MRSRMFRDRADAGRRLAEMLAPYADRVDAVVLALPRGGVPVGYEIASALRIPLDAFVVRKLGAPGREELAMGAIASGGAISMQREVLDSMDITTDEVESAIERERAELQRREALYGQRSQDVRGKTVIVVDDGLATGSSMRAAIAALRELGPGKIVVAVPVAAPDVCAALGSFADEAYCLEQPERLMSVGSWYHDFSQTTDDEVRDLLWRARQDVGNRV